MTYWKKTKDGFRALEKKGKDCIEERRERVDADCVRHVLLYGGKSRIYHSYSGFDRGPGLQRVMRELMAV